MSRPPNPDPLVTIGIPLPVSLVTRLDAYVDQVKARCGGKPTRASLLRPWLSSLIEEIPAVLPAAYEIPLRASLGGTEAPAALSHPLHPWKAEWGPTDHPETSEPGLDPMAARQWDCSDPDAGPVPIPTPKEQAAIDSWLIWWRKERQRRSALKEVNHGQA